MSSFGATFLLWAAIVGQDGVFEVVEQWHSLGEYSTQMACEEAGIALHWDSLSLFDDWVWWKCEEATNGE